MFQAHVADNRGEIQMHSKSIFLTSRIGGRTVENERAREKGGERRE
jgi:hypothetical protein